MTQNAEHTLLLLFLIKSFFVREKSQGSSVHRTHQVISAGGENDLDNRASQHVGTPLHAWEG